MEICTIGFTQKSAPQFFGALRDAGIKQLVDIRLNNVSQLAGFTRKGDLPFFLREICDAGYLHEPLLAPTQELLDDYRKNGADWSAYEVRFNALMAERRIEDAIDPELFTTRTALLCSEPSAERCHRRLVVEYLSEKWGPITVSHL
jgi:uncharacterized protein (DUF488 family)